MSTPDTGQDDESEDPHTAAADAFARRAIEADLRELENLYLFGSTVRGNAAGLSSDVDFLAIVSDDADRRMIEDRLGDLAYDVMLEFGPVVEVHVLSRSRFEEHRDQDHPFVERVVSEAEAYV